MCVCFDVSCRGHSVASCFINLQAVGTLLSCKRGPERTTGSPGGVTLFSTSTAGVTYSNHPLSGQCHNMHVFCVSHHKRMSQWFRCFTWLPHISLGGCDYWTSSLCLQLIVHLGSSVKGASLSAWWLECVVFTLHSGLFEVCLGRSVPCHSQGTEVQDSSIVSSTIHKIHLLFFIFLYSWTFFSLWIP